MANDNTKAPQVFLTSFDENSFVIDKEGDTLFAQTIAPRGFQVPEGYTGAGAPFHEQHVDSLPVFDITFGFRSGAFFDVKSPYGSGFYSKTTGSGETYSNPTYPAEYITTSSRIYDYFASVLNNHDDFVLGSSSAYKGDTVDLAVFLTFRNRKMKKGLKLGSFEMKHYASGAADYISSDFYLGRNFFTQSGVGPYSTIIQKGTTDYKNLVLKNKDRINERIIGRVYKNQGIVMIDFVKAFMRNSNGDFLRLNAHDWPMWDNAWSISAPVSSSFSWSLDRIKEHISRIAINYGGTAIKRTFFCRGYMDQFNHSTNETFWSGSDDDRINMISRHDPPFTYVTTLGLYNDENELMAVGKLNKPLKKDGNSEIHITARVNY